jgi:hypothetical protein
MDMSVASVVLPPALPAAVQQTVARAQGAVATPVPSATSDAPNGQQATARNAATLTDAQAARRKDANSQAADVPGFNFVYEGKHEVMKVNNAKGVLIYQVPSKGQLTLIEADERREQALRLTA